MDTEQNKEADTMTNGNSSFKHSKDALGTVLILVAFAFSNLVSGCGGGGDWVVNPANEHYYLVIECGEWADCEGQAVAKGAHLVTVNDEAEQTWLIATFGERELYWTGLNDEAQEGIWAWTSGEPVSFTNWAPGEPNDKWECGEDYVYFSWREPGWWNDMGPCSPEWDTVAQGIIERPEPPGPGLWWLILLFVVLVIVAAVVVTIIMRRRATSR